MKYFIASVLLLGLIGCKEPPTCVVEEVQLVPGTFLDTTYWAVVCSNGDRIKSFEFVRVGETGKSACGYFYVEK